MYGVLSLRSHRVPSFGAFYRLLPAWLRRTAAAALTLGTIGALGAILTVMAEDPGVRVPVIMYHAVMDDASRLGKYVISPEELESDFKWLSVKRLYGNFIRRPHKLHGKRRRAA